MRIYGIKNFFSIKNKKRMIMCWFISFSVLYGIVSIVIIIMVIIIIIQTLMISGEA